MEISAYFKDIFEKELLADIEAEASALKINAGEVILDLGQIVRNIPLVMKGTIKIIRIDSQGRELLLYYVRADEGCAMTFTCCMEQNPSEIKATVEEDAELVLIPIEMMDKWIMKYSTWKSFVMRTIRNRFNELLLTVDQIAFQKLDQRLIRYLKQKSKVSGSSLINLSHEEIASELATSRVVISRLLKSLENDKKVLLYRNQVKLLSAL